MTLDNDSRGWIMTLASGIACILGASIICVDIIIRQFPGHKGFKIQDSNFFLSSSLSLSFGVMLFSALYSMLPSAKSSLTQGGFSPKSASWILIACFIAGIVGIQVVSRILHRYIPSHVVDCDHTHDEEDSQSLKDGSRRRLSRATQSSHPSELSHDANIDEVHQQNEMAMRDSTSTLIRSHRDDSKYSGDALSRRTSLPILWGSKVTELMASKNRNKKCDTHSQCFGFSEPCGLECFKNISARGGSRLPSYSASTVASGTLRHPGLARSATTTRALPRYSEAERQPLLEDVREIPPSTPQHQSHPSPSVQALSRGSSYASIGVPPDCDGIAELEEDDEHDHAHDASAHHHHVPTNAFLSIGLQTSIAIALHKLPEGFITYATNHANPQLGFSVFMALFIHNITEGFAMALPLYLAINSRWKAMFWSSLLGGVSQPLGAGIAALWFKLAGSGEDGPGEAVYGCMFAVTAGIMASVALQLFSESLDLTHDRNLCMAFAFVGMGILGVSSALTA